MNNSPSTEQTGPGELPRVFPSVKMTRPHKRFAYAAGSIRIKNLFQRMLVRLADAQFQYIPNAAAPFHAHMNARICFGV